MLTEVERRNKELQRQLEESRAACKAREQENSTLQESLKGLLQERQYLEYKLEQLKRMLFGKKSEKSPPRADGTLQLELFEEAVEEIRAEETEEDDTHRRRKRRGNRKPIPKDLPRERVEIDVDPEMRVCPDCGQDMQCIGEHICEELEYVPALLYVIEYALKKYACKKCQTGVVMERVPERPIKKGRPGPGLLAYVLVSKYQDHLPLYRLERIFGRHGLELSRKTLCGWVQAMAELLRPIVESMRREMFKSRVLQADETPVKVQDPNLKGKTRKAYIWTYGIPDAEVVYDFRMGRSRDGPLGFLADFDGHLQTDAYAGYKELFRGGRVVRLGCWAHVRRKFNDAQGEKPEFGRIVVAAIQKLYRIEREAKAKGLIGETLVVYRREHALPTLKQIKSLLQTQQARVLPKSGMGAAIGYALGQWDDLLRYVDIPDAQIDNNSAERSIRGVAIGRKNWLFVGHPNAGPKAAIILSLVETCRRLGAEPFEYLKDVISKLSKNPDHADALTPRAWLEAKRSQESEKLTVQPSR
jgi:transposase